MASLDFHICFPNSVSVTWFRYSMDRENIAEAIVFQEPLKRKGPVARAFPENDRGGT